MADIRDDDLLTCFLVNIDQTFKNDGALGGFLGQTYTDEQQNLTEGVNIDYWRILYDNLFNFIVMMLVVELIAGIIIDKFSELREANERMND